MNTEPRDIQLPQVLKGLLVIAGLILVGGLVSWSTVRFFGGPEFFRRFPTSRAPPPPRLQIDPKQDLSSLRQSEEHILTSYAWVDRPQGIIRIPIARALELLSARGLPSRPAGRAERDLTSDSASRDQGPYPW